MKPLIFIVFFISITQAVKAQNDVVSDYIDYYSGVAAAHEFNGRTQTNFIKTLVEILDRKLADSTFYPDSLKLLEIYTDTRSETQDAIILVNSRKETDNKYFYKTKVFNYITVFKDALENEFQKVIRIGSQKDQSKINQIKNDFERKVIELKRLKSICEEADSSYRKKYKITIPN